jgi:rhamnopyranosyl-N-acetylglucosaminyl-diphospho-decaprenol beta-1,3/1,4-galactofuranosyltransferase
MNLGEIKNTKRILAAVVTFNRLGLLKRSVEALRLQTYAPDLILIIDNSSTDGTAEWLKDQAGLEVIRQPNSGCAGGCNRATKFGFEEGYDWIWLMDDDTIPRPEALERLVASPAFERADTGFVYSLQVYPDGSVPVNDPGPTGQNQWTLTLLQERCIPVKVCSFVAVMVSSRAIAKIGYPIQEMFFMGDDHEFTRRITSNGYRGFCVLDSVVLHDTKLPAAFDCRSWSPLKMRYSLRNHVYLFRTSTLSFPKKVKYISALFLTEIGRLFTGASNLNMIFWALKGFWFRPQVEVPMQLP